MTSDATAPSLWRNRRYVAWLVSDTAKGLATALGGFAIPLITLVITDDPAQAGIVGGVGLVARLLTTLYSGVLADRHARIGLMLLGAGVGALIAASFTLLALMDAVTFTIILIVEVLLMIRAGLFEPASESALKEIVPAEVMGRAQAANQGRDAALQLAGGPLGGALLSVGAWLVGMVMTLSYSLAAVTAAVLRRRMRATPAAKTPTSPATSRRARPNALAEIRAGFSWLFSRPDLGGVLLIITIVNLGFNAVITTVIYALQQSGYSELLIGSMSAALGAVMLVGAIVAPVFVHRVGAGVLTITGVSGTTTAAVIISMVTDPWLIVAVLGAAVFLLPALNASMMGYFMVATPTELLGRANSAAGVLGMGAMPLAPLVAGFGLALVGRQNTILFSAGLCAVAVLLAVTNKALRALPAEEGWAAHSAQFENRRPEMLDSDTV